MRRLFSSTTRAAATRRITAALPATQNFGATLQSRCLHNTPNVQIEPSLYELPPDDVPPLSEDDLENLVSDLFARPPPHTPHNPVLESLKIGSKTEPADPMAVIDALQRRLDNENPKLVAGQAAEDLPQKSLSERLLARSQAEPPIDLDLASAIPSASHIGKTLQKMEEAISRVEQSLPSSSTRLPAVCVPLGLATRQEWESLFYSSIETGNRASAVKILDLMERSGLEVETTLKDRLLFSYMYAGDVQGVESYMQILRQAGPPTESQRHMHIQVYLNSALYKDAQTVLHSYETQGLLPPEITYRTFIHTLFQSPRTSAHHRALAWDLFAHMRYVAYPVPSEETYTTMLEACSSAAKPSPERALDLFYEMTNEHRIAPTAATYNAVMLTCARSPKQEFRHETYRLGAQLLDEFQNATAATEDAVEARERMKPTLGTFKAMLEAAKRDGDLAKGRWILAELVRANQQVDEGLMAHVFHVYAAYKPTFKREAVVTVKTSTPKTPEEERQEPAASSVQLAQSQVATTPQTSQEVLRETEALFARIITSRSLTNPPAMHPDYPFSDVQITTNLLNAYLSVHTSHAPLQAALAVFRETFEEHKCGRNSMSFSTVFDRLLMEKTREGRKRAKGFAEEVWPMFLEFVEGSTGAVSSRRVEAVWSSMIRITALAGDVDQSLELVKAFQHRYPPTQVVPKPKASSPNSRSITPISSSIPPLSDRISLTAPQPLVRLTTTATLPDPAIPPFLAFADVAPLHAKLVFKSQAGGLEERRKAKKAIAYLTWLLNAYGGGLRRRREWVVKGGE